MKFRRIVLVAFIVVSLIVTSCKHQPDRAFYYWKSAFKLTQLEKNRLAELNVNHLYIKFFDVDFDEASGQIQPIACILFTDKIPSNVKVTPVIYIVNRTLLKTKFNEMAELAHKIFEQTKYLASKNGITFNEIQIDCDWTEKTKNNFFGFLNILRNKLDKEDIELSATIRLHQIKYKKITGVPPVDKGILMYYNMGTITQKPSRNSIFNASDAAKYIDYISDYPLKLDIALPAFSWGIHIRKKRVIELLNNMNHSDFKSNGNFAEEDSSIYIAKESFFYRGFYFMKNDSVKVEEITPEICKIATNQLKGKLSRKAQRVAIFHLDSLTLSRYENKDFEEVFNAYR